MRENFENIVVECIFSFFDAMQYGPSVNDVRHKCPSHAS